MSIYSDIMIESLTDYQMNTSEYQRHCIDMVLKGNMFFEGEFNAIAEPFEDKKKLVLFYEKIYESVSANEVENKYYSKRDLDCALGEYALSISKKENYTAEDSQVMKKILKKISKLDFDIDDVRDSNILLAETFENVVDSMFNDSVFTDIVDDFIYCGDKIANEYYIYTLDPQNKELAEVVNTNGDSLAKDLISNDYFCSLGEINYSLVCDSGECIFGPIKIERFIEGFENELESSQSM